MCSEAQMLWRQNILYFKLDYSKFASVSRGFHKEILASIWERDEKGEILK